MATKKRLEIKANSSQTAETLEEVGPGTPTKVLEVAPGKVTFLDKVKGYYHTVLTLLAAIVVFLNEVTPITAFLPESGRHWVSIGVIFLTALLNFLKSNEVWVDSA